MQNTHGIQDTKELEAQIGNLQVELDYLRQSISDKLDLILEQTKRTNGRVTKLEDWAHSHELGTKDYEAKVEAELLEYKFIKKYPKMIVIVLAIIVALFVLEKLKV